MLRENIHSLKVSRYDTITYYLTKITHIHDELGSFGEKVED
jgi:hypothetical protein